MPNPKPIYPVGLQPFTAEQAWDFMGQDNAPFMRKKMNESMQQLLERERAIAQIQLLDRIILDPRSPRLLDFVKIEREILIGFIQERSE